MNIELANIAFNIANLAFVVGGLGLIYDYFKKPMPYKLYSVIGTAIGMLMTMVGYFCLDNSISMVLVLPNAIFWSVAMFYSLKERFK